MADGNSIEIDLEAAPRPLLEIADRVKAGGDPPKATVRDLLTWFGYQRRGYNVVEIIKEVLDSLNLLTKPPFSDVWIDSEVEFFSKARRELESVQVTPVEQPQEHPRSEVSLPTDEPSSVPAAGVDDKSDPTYRISRLQAASQGVVAVALEDDISVALTIMLEHDFSQLPVMIGPQDIGMITLRSIEGRVAVGKDYSKVRYCLDPSFEVREDASIFDAVETIVKNGYILVRGLDNTIKGIVTASDLSRQFRQLAEPFLVIGEIERRIRKLLSGFDAEAIKLGAKAVPTEAVDYGNHVSRELRNPENNSGLTFGHYVRFMQWPDNWAKIGLTHISRKDFVRNLDRVREIRNEVMHFNTDPLDSELDIASRFCQFLRLLDGLSR